MATVPSNLFKICQICGDTGDALHFGAMACRACAAFFRRSIALNKVYTCKRNGDCMIHSTVRCMCRCCRFEKCITVGMKREAVQRFRDSLGKRLPDSTSNDLEAESYSASLLSGEATPILSKLNASYLQLNHLRKMIHKREGESPFSTPTPKVVSCKEANAIHVKEVNIIADWISNSYAEFSTLDPGQKRVLFTNFFIPFMLLETGFYSMLHGRSDIIILGSGDYIDTKHPETFYLHDTGDPEKVKEAVRMFAPSFDFYRRNIRDPMKNDKVDQYEFFALTSLTLWDHGLLGQSEDCEVVSKAVRNKVIQELVYYYRHIRRMPEYSLRLANILVLLPALQRCVRRFHEDTELSHMFNVYTVNEEFYEIVNGKFAVLT